VRRIFISADHGMAIIYFLQSDVVSTLLEAGVAKLFTPGTSTADVLAFVKDEVEPRRALARA